MATNDPLHSLTALEQGELIASGDLTSLALVEHYLARADEVGAFITRTPERALATAAALGRPGPNDGPLFGVPTAIKDLNATAGVRTTFGSAAYADYVPEVSDNVTLSIEAAKMPWLGKTNTPEFGSPCYTEPDVAPPARTPWDPTRTAGGSSGGAATAVAAALVPLAQGSDGGGSIRIPASCCGLVGFKPSRGVVGSGPMYGDPTGLATSGPIARTVRDAAALLDVLAGPRLGDPVWTPSRHSSYLSACDTPPGKLRIAVLRAPVIADVAVAPEPLAALDAAIALLLSLGHEVEEIDSPIPAEAVATFELNWAVLTALSEAPPGSEELLRPLTRWLAEHGRRVSGPEFGLAIGELRRIGSRALKKLAAYDAVISPTLATLPPKVGALRNDADPQADFDAQKAFTPWTSAWNVTGMPAVSLPLFRAAATAEHPELPVGVMLAGRPGADAALLALSAQLEAAVTD